MVRRASGSRQWRGGTQVGTRPRTRPRGRPRARGRARPRARVDSATPTGQAGSMAAKDGSEAAKGDPLIGRTVGNYVIRREVGRGGMGTVYLAEHVRLGRRVALKVLLPERGRDPGIVSRFFNEARAASDIRNAHIVDVIDFGD